MSTRDSGSSNLLDEFFAPPAGDADEEDVEVVDDVEEGDEADVARPSAAPRRSLPPPPPSMRGGRGASAPPPRGGSSSRASAPPPPPRSTLPGMPEPHLEAQEDDAVPPTVEASALEPERKASFDPETTPGGFEEEAAEHDAQVAALAQEAAGEQEAAAAAADATAAEHDAPSAQEDEVDQLLGGISTPDTVHGEERPSGETDMATAFAASLSLRGDTPSATDSADVRVSDASPVREAGSAGIFDALSSPAEGRLAELGPSSAWPAPTKIDEWDDDWAPSLSALGAHEPERVSTAAAAPPSRRASAGGEERAPFRLSLPPPPPPPLKRPAKIPMPHHAAAPAPSAHVEEATSHAMPPQEPAREEKPEPSQPSIAMEVSPFGAADEPSREDLTRPLPPTELARLAASEDGLDHGDSHLLRDDVTIPLPGLSADSLDAGSLMFSSLPDPYTSDTDLTRPLITLDGKGDGPRSLMLPPLREAPDSDGSEGSDVPLIVAVPPPTVGTVEQSPSIQITPGASGSEYTPTSQLARPFSPTRTSPGMRGVLPPIPKPAPVPTDFGKRGPSHSVVPVAGSVFPPGFTSNRRWLIGLAAAVFGVLALGFALRSRSGSLVVTVAGPSGAAVQGVAVRVDGTERCTSAPCIVKDLKPGMHLVSASGSGLQPSADRAVVLEPGEQVAHHVVLSGEERATAGLSVAAIGSGLHVTVDGRDVGAPPVTLNDVAPGEHTVRILGDERFYQPYEEVVKLDRGEVRSLGPVRLRVLRGKLDLRAGEGADGAAVAVDGRRVWHLPASIELSADESHEVTALKQGFNELTQEVVFDGTAERAVTIAFGGEGTAPPAQPQAAYHPPSAAAFAQAAPARSRAAPAPAMAAAAPATGNATLEITSTPPSAVVVNGRPMGTTPLHNVHVGAGKQVVLFVHPSLGRKVASANVAPGGRATIGVKF